MAGLIRLRAIRDKTGSSKNQRSRSDSHATCEKGKRHELVTNLVWICYLNDVISAIRRLPDKTSAADPIPTSVLKQIADLVAPFVTELFNRSLSTGHFPAAFKEAFITQIVK